MLRDIIDSTVKPVYKDLSRDPKKWSLETGGLLTQVNYSENCTFGTLKGRFFNIGGLYRQMVLGTSSTVIIIVS